MTSNELSTMINRRRKGASEFVFTIILSLRSKKYESRTFKENKALAIKTNREKNLTNKTIKKSQ